jgi:hypothetical protein
VNAAGGENLWYKADLATGQMSEAGNWRLETELPDHGYVAEFGPNNELYPRSYIYNKAEDSWLQLPSFGSYHCKANYICSFEREQLFLGTAEPLNQRAATQISYYRQTKPEVTFFD